MIDPSDPLEQAEDLLIAEEVLANLRHDLRNKLAAIRQAAYYLKTKTQATELWQRDARIARFFTLIDEQIEAADGAFAAHPSLTKLYDRFVRLERTSVLARDAIAALAEPSRVDVGALEDTEIPVDRADLVISLRELLKNAVEASAEGEKVTLTGEVRDEQYAFSITNRGVALEPRDFRNFTRGFTSSREARRGIGLSIARHVATRYSGSLTLIDPPSAPSTTTIVLSVARSAPVSKPTSDEIDAPA